MSWCTQKFKDVCALEKNKKGNEPLPYVGLEHITSNTGVFLGSKEPYEVKSSTFRFTKNHVLYGRLRPYLNKVLLPDFEGHCSSEIFPIMVGENLLREYLYYWFIDSSTVDKINETSTGARMPRANMKEVLNFEIPVPTLKEQKQIVAILDQAFDAIDQAQANIQQNIQNAQDLFQSKLNQIFSQQGGALSEAEGEGWEEKKLVDISNVINGYSFKSNEFNSSYPIKSIKITNVGVKEFVEGNGNNLPESYVHSHPKLRVKSGNLVIALTRTIISTGLKVARVPVSYDGALLNQRVAAIVSNKGIDDDYLYYFFSTGIVFDYVLSNVNTLMQPNLSITDLKNMPIPVCSPDEQKRTSKLIEKLNISINELVKNYTEELKNLEDLKKSLLQKAFSGKLTQDKQAA